MKAIMVKSHTNPSFYARIFVITTLLIAIPCIVLFGSYALSTMNTRGQAVQTSFDAQSISHYLTE